MKFSNAAILIFTALTPCIAHAAPPADLDAYNVVWTSPSQNASGSMPLGNGDISLNAWVEKSGDLVFYIGKTDAWDDNARLLKVGKVRVKLAPAPAAAPFKQELSLIDGTMKVTYADGTQLRLWVDANRPVVHVETSGKHPSVATASIELWRTKPETLPSLECSDVMNHAPKGESAPTIVEPDTLITGLSDRIGWFHRNIKSIGPSAHARIQGMTEYKREDPLLHRTFGALINATNPKRIDDTHLQSAGGTEHRFDIYLYTQHPATPESWLKSISALADSTAAAIPIAVQRRAHEQWWNDFWNRSWISAQLATSAKNNPRDDASYLSQMFALQRFITACAGRGAYPIKFNGSLFTVPAKGAPGDADYRRWGPGYWWQNTRLPYLSMCADGDFEMLEPLFRMYVDQNLPLNKFRTKKYFGFDNSAYFIECIQFWGDVFNESYGWTPLQQRKDPLQTSGYHKWEWVAGPELVWMMLEAYEYTGDETLLQKRILPTADAVIRFFDNYYKTDAQGKLLMHPSQAAETWWDCTNAMPELAGLYAITNKLLALPNDKFPADQRAYYKKFLAKLPPLPIRNTPSGPALAPATKFAHKANCENPELYAVFPFRLCSFEKSNRNLGLNALKHRWDRGNFGWRQDDIFMAYLGLADEARQYVVGRARKHDPGSRFPAFWGPNYDWVPDQDHGGVLMKAAQSMLMQTDGDKIFLLPAWPKEWNVNFKLHAPKLTTVECIYRNGKIEQLKITPESRAKDVVICPPFAQGK